MTFISSSPLVITPCLVAPLMVGLSVLMLLLGLDGQIGRLDGALLFAGIIIYTIWSIYQR